MVEISILTTLEDRDEIIEYLREVINSLEQGRTIGSGWALIQVGEED